MQVGWIIKKEGRYVQVVDYDPAANFWFWRQVREDGTLGRLEYGELNDDYRRAAEHD